MDEKSLPLPHFPPGVTLGLLWRAVYHDGEGKLTDKCLLQYNPDGTENKYSDIDRFLLGRFDLVNRQQKVIYSMYLHKNQRLIYRRRNFVPVLNPNARWLVYLVGWQMTMTTPMGQKNITAINYIFPDGSVALDDKRTGIELLPEEA